MSTISNTVSTRSSAHKKIIYPEALIKRKHAPSSSEYIDECIVSDLFGTVKIRYVPRMSTEAQAYPYQNRIDISRKFFEIPDIAGRKHVLQHELGHFFETLVVFSGKPSYFWVLNDSGIFGKGTVTRGGVPYFDGCFSTTGLKESIAECFAVYTSPKPSELKKRYPEAYEYIKSYYP